MIYTDFEKEIQKIDPRFTVLENPNRPGLNNIYFEGKNYDLPTIADEIKEEIDPAYRYVFPHGATIRNWSQGEVIGRLETFLKQYNAGELEGLYD